MTDKISTVFFKKKYPRLYRRILYLYGGAQNIFDFTAAYTLYKNKRAQPVCEICGSAVAITKKFRELPKTIRCKKHVNTNNAVTKDELAAFSHNSKYTVIATPDKILTRTDQISICCPEHGEYTQTIGYYLSGGQCQQCYHCSRIGIARGPHSDKTKQQLSKQKTGKKIALSEAARERKTAAQKLAWRRRRENTEQFLKYTTALSTARKEYIKRNGFVFPKKEKTSIEKHFEDFLVSKKIAFESQYVFLGKKYDFYLPSLDLLVEVDGEYWHRMPASIKNDKEKHSTCLHYRRQLVRISSDDFNPEVIFMSEDDRNKHTKQILENRGIYGFY